MHRCVGELDDAEAELDRAIECYGVAGDARGIASCLNNRGVIALDRAEFGAARDVLQQSLDLCEEHGDELLAALVLNNLGLATSLTGELREALAICRRGRRLLIAQGNVHGLSWIEDNIASVLTLAGHPAWAVDIHRRTIRRRIDLGDEIGFVSTLEALAEAWTGCGETHRAGVALGFAAAHRRRIGTLPAPMLVALTRRRTDALVARIGDARFRTLWQEGAAMTPEQAREWVTG
jgi:ATP/maltotriose-dependent transcriptional regulator MalT